MTDPAVLLRQLAAEPAADADLLRRFAINRDATAFAELVRRHGPVVLAACRRGVRHHHDAEDAFQAVFLVLARRAASIRRPALLGNWLYRVAVGVARNARRAAARRRAREVQAVDVPEPAAPARPPDDLGPVLDEELEALAAWYRDAVVLCDVRGLSRADAAAQLGVPLGTLASRLDGGRKRLAARLARRGVALSVGVVLAEGRAAAVPEALLTTTCGLVADWAAGASVPAAVLRLARGGSTMKGVLLGGVLALSLAAGAALAAGFAQPPAPPPNPPAPDAPVAAAQPDAKAPPAAAEPPAKLGAPRLRRTEELKLKDVSSVAWSRDGTWLAVAGRTGGEADENSLVIVSPPDPQMTAAQFPLPAQTALVGFTSDGKSVLTATREAGLISAEHTLHRVGVSRVERTNDPNGPRVVGIAADTRPPGSIPDGGERLTLTGPQDVRFLVRTPTKVTVWHADIRFESRRPLGAFDGTFGDLRLTPDGRRVIGLAGQGVVEGYDAATGNKLWATEPAVKLPDIKLDPTPWVKGPPPYSTLAVGLSDDGRRAVIARGRQTPVVVLDLDTGKALPLPVDLGTISPSGVVAVSGDGRLAALGYTSLISLEGKERPKGLPAGLAAVTHTYGPTRLTVWETASGTVVRTWDGRASAVAFHPTRPQLAVMEAYRGSTRLGLWDFTPAP